MQGFQHTLQPGGSALSSRPLSGRKRPTRMRAIRAGERIRGRPAGGWTGGASASSRTKQAREEWAEPEGPAPHRGQPRGPPPPAAPRRGPPARRSGPHRLQRRQRLLPSTLAALSLEFASCEAQQRSDTARGGAGVGVSSSSCTDTTRNPRSHGERHSSRVRTHLLSEARGLALHLSVLSRGHANR
jgi:hypothetical protein